MSEWHPSADNLPQLLSERLKLPLSGQQAQCRFAPQLAYGRHFGPRSHNARQAAVLVLLTREASGWHIPLTLRPTHLPAHAGQISFPGGELEPAETCEQAALREIQEEMGAQPDCISVLGRLTPLFVFASNFWVTPVLAMANRPPEYEANPAEVAAIITPTLVQLCDTQFHTRRDVRRRGVTLNVPGIVIGEHFVWGATAMILGELISILDEVLSRHHE